jgi:hypothetical protein
LTLDLVILAEPSSFVGPLHPLVGCARILRNNTKNRHCAALPEARAPAPLFTLCHPVTYQVVAIAYADVCAVVVHRDSVGSKAPSVKSKADDLVSRLKLAVSHQAPLKDNEKMTGALIYESGGAPACQ